METILNKASQFSYHSFQYERPTSFTSITSTDDYLFVAEMDNPLRGARLKLFWAANTVEALLNGIEELIKDLQVHNRNVKLFLEHIPPQFVKPLEVNGLTVVSEWVDFWLNDLPGRNWTMPQTVATIRPLCEGEATAVAEVTRTCKGVSREFYGETEQSVKDWLAEDDTDIFVAEVDGKIVGTCFMAQYGFDNPKGSVAWLRELAVHPDYQQKGIGRALAITGLQWGQKRKAQRSFLATDVLNDHAIRLYETLGYQQSEGRGQINVVKEVGGE